MANSGLPIFAFSSLQKENYYNTTSTSTGSFVVTLVLYQHNPHERVKCCNCTMSDYSCFFGPFSTDQPGVIFLDQVSYSRTQNSYS